MRETALALMPQAAAISAAVQRVLSPGGGLEVNATTRSATSGPSGAMREGRVLSRSKPTTPSCMNRSCQRQTQVLDLRVRRIISLVPRPSAESSTISARHTCFCGALRSFKITFSRLRSEGFNVMDIPVRMRQTRTSGAAWESQMGFKCQTETTSEVWWGGANHSSGNQIQKSTKYRAKLKLIGADKQEQCFRFCLL